MEKKSVCKLSAKVVTLWRKESISPGTFIGLRNGRINWRNELVLIRLRKHTDWSYFRCPYKNESTIFFSRDCSVRCCSKRIRSDWRGVIITLEKIFFSFITALSNLNFWQFRLLLRRFITNMCSAKISSCWYIKDNRYTFKGNNSGILSPFSLRDI